jgi:hypothetical protein
MKNSSIYIIYFLLFISINGCELFSTRQPHEPDDSSTDFQPASTHYILFTNFNNSFNRLNVEYYYDCFLDDSQSSSLIFRFNPDADALARYGILYSSWNKDSERQFIQGLRSSLAIGVFPILIWKSKKYDLITSDSAVFIGEYLIQIKQKDAENNYSGISRFVFARNSNGLWYIKSWADFRNPTDTLPTWSILKARFAL